MQRDRVVLIGHRRLREALRDLLFRLPQDVARLPLALGLRLPRHRVLQRLRDLHVANLDRLHGDAPRIGLLVENALQLAPHRLAVRNHLRQLVPSDRFAQRGLRAHRDGLHEILHFEDRFLRVPHQPEHDGVHIHRHRVARERGFGRHAGHAHPLIDVPAERIDNGNHVEQARPAQSDIASEPQQRHLLPLIGDLDGEQQIDADQRSREERRPIVQNCRKSQTHRHRNGAQRHCHRTDLIQTAIPKHDAYLLFLPASFCRSCNCSINSSTVKPSEPARAVNSPVS